MTMELAKGITKNWRTITVNVKEYIKTMTGCEYDFISNSYKLTNSTNIWEILRNFEMGYRARFDTYRICKIIYDFENITINNDVPKIDSECMDLLRRTNVVFKLHNQEDIVSCLIVALTLEGPRNCDIKNWSMEKAREKVYSVETQVEIPIIYNEAYFAKKRKIDELNNIYNIFKDLSNRLIIADVNDKDRISLDGVEVLGNEIDETGHYKDAKFKIESITDEILFDQIILVGEKYTQIGTKETVEKIVEVTKRYAEEIRKEHNIDEEEPVKICWNIGNIQDIKNQTISLGNVIVDLMKDKIFVQVGGTDQSVLNDINSSIETASNYIYGSADKPCIGKRIKYINRTLKPGYVGILYQYNTAIKARDEFGCLGKGEVLSSRIAIIRSLNKDNMEIEVFNGARYFVTKMHYAVLNDIDNIDRVPVIYNTKKLMPRKVEKISYSKIGMFNMFFGEEYHWASPLQESNDESYYFNMWNYDESTNDFINVKYTRPERIKAVLDDWEIEYDKEYLNKVIEETNEILKSSD